MGNFSENIVNQRFRQVFQELEKYNLIKGKSDIAKKLGTYNHVVNSILKGQRNITVDQLNKLFEIYQINILNASFLAMHRAIEKLSILPELLLIDGNRFKPYKDLF